MVLGRQRQLLRLSYREHAVSSIHYIRRDTTVQGIFYAGGKSGPTGDDLRSPSWWSPDGTRVVYSRYALQRQAEPVKLWSRNSNYELFSSAWFPAYDATGEHLAVSMQNPATKTTSPARPILEKKELILFPH